jgi:hypothetical protein
MSRVSAAKSLPHLEEFDDLPDLPKLPTQYRQEAVTPKDTEMPNPAAEEAAAKAARHEALIERTRLSMSNMASVTKAAQLERRRSIKLAARTKRMSYLPKTHALETTIEDDNTIETEKLDKMTLIEGGEHIDYEAVFKSRPKIKTSPESSPVRAWSQMGAAANNGLGSSSPAEIGR